MSRLGQFFILLAVVGFVQTAKAHESRPAYLEINETIAGRYDVIWRTPLNAGMPLPIILKFSEGVSNVTEPSVRDLGDSVIERRLIKVNGSLAGKRIDFVGITSNHHRCSRPCEDAGWSGIDHAGSPVAAMV